MTPYSERIHIEYLCNTPEILTVEASFSGERPVRFHLETRASVWRKVVEQGWYAQPNLIIVSKLDDSELSAIVYESLQAERALRYRPWQSPNAAQRPSRTDEHRVEYYGDPDEIPRDRWIDVAVHLKNGDILALTVETPFDIDYSMRDDGIAFYRCLDLLIVREIDRELVERAVASLVNDDIYRYGILSDSKSEPPSDD
jgi:hypothetical protein